MLIIGEPIPLPLTWYSWITWRLYYSHLEPKLNELLADGILFEEIMMDFNKQPYNPMDMTRGHFLRPTSVIELIEQAVKCGEITTA